MKADGDYKDLEDTVQYIMAQQSACELILTNDTGFVAKDLEANCSTEFLQVNGLV